MFIINSENDSAVIIYFDRYLTFCIFGNRQSTNLRTHEHVKFHQTTKIDTHEFKYFHSTSTEKEVGWDTRNKILTSKGKVHSIG